MKASLAAGVFFQLLRFVSMLIALAEEIADNDDALEQIKAQASAEGREVGAEDIRTAINGMKAARESLAEKLGAPPAPVAIG